MTSEDRNEFRAIVKEELGQALESAKSHTDASIRTAVESAKSHTDASIRTAVESAKSHTDASIRAFRDEMIEAVRDMQTEMLRGLERFSRGNFSRFHTIETTQADVNTRLGLLEERVLAVELRVPPQLPLH